MRTLFHNAACWSSGEKIFDGLLIEDDLIVAVGRQALASNFDSHVDLAGRFLMPAFLDGHAHPLFGGREASGPKINGLTSLDEILTEVKNFATQNPNTPWIIGGAYEAAVIEGGRFDAHWLDSVVSDRPVILHAVDHHTIWVNSEALRIAGITEKTPDPIGGTITRRSDGSAQGTLREPSAMALILDVAPSLSIVSEVAAIKAACNAYLNAGVTAAIDSCVEKDMAHAYLAAAKTGDLSIAMSLSFLAAPIAWRSKVEFFVDMRKKFAALPDPNLVLANSIKFLTDGALSVGTAALLEPYLDDPDSQGIKIWSDTELLEALIEFDALHFQVHIHAIGDAAVQQALDAIEVMIGTNPLWDRRPVIVHAQLIRDEDLPRFKELGVIANIQPLWCYLDPMNKELILPRLGTTRNDRQYRLRSLIDSGATIAYGSDWPVTSEVPLRALAVPVNRVPPGSKEQSGWSLNEAITIDESLTFYTSAVAHQMFRETERGRLAPGMKADFLILDKNPMNIDPSEVSEIEIHAMYQNGVRVRQ